MGSTHVEQVETILRDWLDEPRLTLICGDWRAGSIMEIVPDGPVKLTGARYPEPFGGLRDLHIPGQPHHLHLDLAKLRYATYVMSPSVCYGYRPSFELRFHGADEGGQAYAFALGLRDPYAKDGAHREPLVRYFRRLLEHHARFPDVVRHRCAPSAQESAKAGWLVAGEAMREAVGRDHPLDPSLAEVVDAATLSRALAQVVPRSAAGDEERPPAVKLRIPQIVELVKGALALPGASLVIYRQRTLVEFKTERLGGGLTLYQEDGHVSWQIGDFDDHHCHVDVGRVARVVFGAEPVSCQGGRLNYTAWFLVDEDCGNPYRPQAYFSVTLNAPYDADGKPRLDVIEPIFALRRRFAEVAEVSAEEAFLASERELAREHPRDLPPDLPPDLPRDPVR